MKKAIALAIGESIKGSRTNENVTQEELAQKIGISPRSLQSIEAGDFQPSYETLFKIAMFLKTTPATLLESAWTQWPPK